MSVVKRVVLLLLLVAVCSNAAPGPEDCEGLKKRLPTTDLNKIFGDWILVWSVTNTDHELLGNLSSSHTELKLLSDNKTIVFHERSMSLTNTSSCTTYDINMMVNSNSVNLTLQDEPAMVSVKDAYGVVQRYNETIAFDVYDTEGHPDCLLMVYRGSHSGRYLLSYRREGSHRDVDQLKAAHDHLKKRAECLGFPTDRPFSYDGAADLCQKKSAADVKPDES